MDRLVKLGSPSLALVAMLAGCARENSAYANGGTDVGQSGGQSAGSPSSTTVDGTTTKTSESNGSRGSTTGTLGVTGEPDTSTTMASGAPGETGAPPVTTGGCEVITLDVEADTFVTNAESECGVGCSDWTFTGTEQYDIRTAGTFDSIMLLRFQSAEPAVVDSATLVLHVGEPISNDAGLVEIHILETQSVWDHGNTEGPIPGQPTWNRAASGGAQWTDGEGDPVADFDELHNDWPTVPVEAGDGADGALVLPILAEDLPALNARLAAMAPVQIGVTILAQTQEGAISALTIEAGEFAELDLVVCR